MSVGFVGAHPLGRPFHEGVGPDAPGRRVFDVTAVVAEAEAPGAGHAALVFVGGDEAQVLVPGEEGFSARHFLQVVVLVLVDDEILEMIAELPVKLSYDLAREIDLAVRDLAAHLVIRGRQGFVIEGLVAVEAVEVEGFLVGERGGEGEAHARNQETVVVAEHVELGAFGEPGCFQVHLLPGVGIPAALAEVINVGQGAELEALVLVERHDGEGAEGKTGFLDGFLVLCRSRHCQKQGDQHREDTFHMSIYFCFNSKRLCMGTRHIHFVIYLNVESLMLNT